MAIPFHSPIRAYETDRSEIDAAVSRVLASGRYILGPEVERFEDEFANYLGVSEAVGVASGTDALVLALRAARVEPGDEVITAPNAGGYTASACCLIGARPVFADVDATTLTIDPTSVERLLGSKTRCVVATHLYGSMADVTRLSSLTRERGIALVEDCAQAHGARFEGRAAGSFGELATFSFYPTKNLGALGDGGAVVSRDEGLGEVLRELRQYGWRPKYDVQRLGGTNSRLDPIQAAILRVRLPRLDDRNARRRELADRYEDRLAQSGLSICRTPGDTFVGHLLVVQSQARDALKAALDAQDVGTEIHFPLLDCDQAAWKGLGWRSDALPAARMAVGRILSLPLYPELTEAEVDEVCDAVASGVGAGTAGGNR
jgi:dTDP-4-amino-4,6-dideoxygalactose transaminase